MGIGKLLVLGLIIWLVWFLFKKAKLLALKAPSKTSKVTSIRQCAVCAVHIPENEAVVKNGRYYCCQSHADQR